MSSTGSGSPDEGLHVDEDKWQAWEEAKSDYEDDPEGIDTSGVGAAAVSGGSKHEIDHDDAPSAHHEDDGSGGSDGEHGSDGSDHEDGSDGDEGRATDVD